MSDKEYFSFLYEIASRLNKEFSLHSALRISLEKTVQLLNLETGWIWLVQGDVKSVYLAASYNLPPALSDYPERLSGYCYCIAKYFSNDIPTARNISEIACTRLKNIESGTGDLKFHATIPITTNGQKVGLINLLHKESQQLNEKQLSVLNTVSELIGIAVQRTRAQSTYPGPTAKNNSVFDVINRIFNTRIRSVVSHLNKAKNFAEQNDAANALQSIEQSLSQMGELQSQLSVIEEESVGHLPENTTEAGFRYPDSPLTTRELEALALVKKGYTNKRIAERLFISERTVKFHLSSILSKLNARTRTEAVETAVKRGLLGL